MLANISLIFSSLCSTPFLWGPAAKVLKVCDNVLSKARQKEELEITELSVVQQDLEASTIPRSAAICSVPSAQPSSEAGHSLLPSKARPAAATLAALHRKAVLGNIMLSWKFLLFLWHIISFTSFFFFFILLSQIWHCEPFLYLKHSSFPPAQSFNEFGHLEAGLTQKIPHFRWLWVFLFLRLHPNLERDSGQKAFQAGIHALKYNFCCDFGSA